MSEKPSSDIGEKRLKGQSQQWQALAAGENRGECLAVCCASSLFESHSSESASVGRLEFSSEGQEE